MFDTFDACKYFKMIELGTYLYQKKNYNIFKILYAVGIVYICVDK